MPKKWLAKHATGFLIIEAEDWYHARHAAAAFLLCEPGDLTVTQWS